MNLEKAENKNHKNEIIRTEKQFACNVLFAFAFAQTIR
jgi:hypothetical protein